MKRKRGYTLIEMITVVILLAILALIVTPLILRSVKNSKEQLYKTQLENIKSAARLYMIDLDLENDATIILTLNELIESGHLSKNIKNPKTGEEFDECMLVSVTNFSDVYKYDINETASNCQTVSNYIMIIYGELEVNAIYGEEYVEPGVIVRKENGKQLDSNDINVEVIQKKDGSEISTTGTYEELPSLIKTDDYYEYEIIYQYEEGNNVVSGSRKVVVKDKNNLQCIILPVGSKNSAGWVTDNRKAEILLLNSNKKVEYSISTTGAKNYGTNRTINVDHDGEVKIYGYVKDKSGNEGVCTSLIKFETKGPTCNIELSGKLGNNGWYLENVEAKLKINNKLSQITNQGISLNNSTDYNGKSNLTLSHTGTVYGYIKDEAGKEITCNTTVKIDDTPPIITNFNGYGVINSNTIDLILNVEAYDDESGISKYEVYDASSGIQLFESIITSDNTATFSGTITESTKDVRVNVYNNINLLSTQTKKICYPEDIENYRTECENKANFYRASCESSCNDAGGTGCSSSCSKAYEDSHSACVEKYESECIILAQNTSSEEHVRPELCSHITNYLQCDNGIIKTCYYDVCPWDEGKTTNCSCY